MLTRSRRYYSLIIQKLNVSRSHLNRFNSLPQKPHIRLHSEAQPAALEACRLELLIEEAFRPQFTASHSNLSFMHSSLLNGNPCGYATTVGSHYDLTLNLDDQSIGSVTPLFVMFVGERKKAAKTPAAEYL